MTTLTWTGSANDGNPNNPDNWYPQGIPNTYTAVVFPWGDIKIEPGYSWSASSITVTGGAQVAFASIPHVSGSFTVQSGGAAYITALSGLIDVTTLIVNGGARFISAVFVEAVSLAITSGSEFIAQNGLIVTTCVEVWGGSRGEAYGNISIGHPVDVQPGSSWNTAPRQNCYARGTRILMHDGTEMAIEAITAGDRVHGGHIVNWVGMSSRPAKFVNIRGLIVTEDHLVVQGDALYQAKVIPGAVPSDYSGDYFHIQCAYHVLVIANGVESESFLDTDGYDDLQTVSGKRLERRFSRRDAFAAIVEIK